MGQWGAVGTPQMGNPLNYVGGTGCIPWQGQCYLGQTTTAALWVSTILLYLQNWALGAWWDTSHEVYPPQTLAGRH